VAPVHLSQTTCGTPRLDRARQVADAVTALTDDARSRRPSRRALQDKPSPSRGTTSIYMNTYSTYTDDCERDKASIDRDTTEGIRDRAGSHPIVCRIACGPTGGNADWMERGRGGESSRVGQGGQEDGEKDEASLQLSCATPLTAQRLGASVNTSDCATTGSALQGAPTSRQDKVLTGGTVRASTGRRTAIIYVSARRRRALHSLRHPFIRCPVSRFRGC